MEICMIRREEPTGHRWHILSANVTCRHGHALAEGIEAYQCIFVELNAAESVTRRKLILRAESGKWGVCRTLCQACERAMLERLAGLGEREGAA
jgi:hypothetical protein